MRWYSISSEEPRLQVEAASILIIDKKGDTLKESRIQKDTDLKDVTAGTQYGCLFSYEDVWTFAGGFHEHNDARLYSDGYEKI
jgi:hypothetical protein